LCYRSWASWLLGNPSAALADLDLALTDAREFAQAATLMNALAITTCTSILCRDCTAANAQIDELSAMAQEKATAYWDAFGTWLRGWLFAVTGKAAESVIVLTSGIKAWRSTAATLFTPTQLSCLASAHGQLGQFDEAWRCIGDATAAIETTGERWFEAEVHRIGGEIALKSREADAAKAKEFFNRALVVARQQQAKSWELRAAMSMARLWRDQGKRDEARDLLAPIYGWFTEGFDTLALKEAKTLLEELAA
jgi:predicted ATPase